MKNIVFMLGCLLFSGAASGSLFVLPADSTQSRIVFDCAINYNGNPIDSTYIIHVEGGISDSLFVMGHTGYENDSIYTIYLDGDSAFSLVENYQVLEFSVENMSQDCYSYNVEYVVNHQESTPSLLVISRFEIFDHYFTFSDSVFCTSRGTFLPQTDIPLEHIDLSTGNGLSLSAGKGIDTDRSSPGMYRIHIYTNYCLEPGKDSLNIFIGSSETPDYPDTIKFCTTTQVDEIMTSEWEIFSGSDTGLTDSLNNITTSGYYYVRPKDSGPCVEPGYVYINLIEALTVTVFQDEQCEQVVVEVIPDEPGQYSYYWSNGSTASIIELDKSDTLTVDIIDINGCTSSQSVEVQYFPFVVESVDYDKIDSDCWEDGQVIINTLNVNYDRGDYSYTLVNTLTGNRIDNMDEVPEGIYQLEVADSRNCSFKFSEDITILQNCLNDYPVFTPDQDGIEDEYFIPHEGTVKIFDRNGVVLKELNTPAYWDGKDDSGNQMPMGNYLMVTETGRVVNITIVR